MSRRAERTYEVSFVVQGFLRLTDSRMLSNFSTVGAVMFDQMYPQTQRLA